MTEIDDIKNKLDRIIENSFLSKLDLMFSVLVSLTLFTAGTVVNITKTSIIFLPISLATLAMFIVTLLGEFWAILNDDPILRLGFWIAMLPCLVLLLFTVLFSIFPPASLINVLFVFFMIWLVWKVEWIYEKYREKLRTRGLPKMHVITKKLWQPSLLNVFAFATVFAISILILLFSGSN